MSCSWLQYARSLSGLLRNASSSSMAWPDEGRFLLNHMSQLFPLVRNRMRIIDSDTLGTAVYSINHIIMPEARSWISSRSKRSNESSAQFIQNQIGQLIALALQIFDSFIIFRPLLRRVMAQYFYQQSRRGQ